MEKALKLNDDIGNALGTVCDAALKSGGLRVINEVNKVLAWAGEPPRDTKEEEKSESK